MTAQINDTIFYRDCEYNIAGIHGDGLFIPQEHGLHPIIMSTACWRGYYCEYEVVDGMLRLRNLHIRLEKETADTLTPDAVPILFSVRPSHDPEWRCSIYGNLAQETPFTGGLLVGADFVRELYVHMGFHPAWKYRRVHELIFDSGKLTAQKDHSAEIALIRNDRIRNSHQPNTNLADQAGGEVTSPNQLRDWIEASFSRSYGGAVRTPEFAPRSTHAGLLLKKVPAPNFRDSDIALICPHCQTSSSRYREVRGSRLVCLSCARSFRAP
jgi:hypothetical protein